MVGTYDGASVRLYIDGVEVGAGTSAAIPIGYGLPDSNDLYIGAYPGPGHFFNGLVDEPSIYNRALSAAEIQTLASGGSNSGGVVVNLPLGTASGLTGGIARVQNVIGSAGNDILVGNGGNVLTGGAGRDVLIAGAVASTLNGGDGEDLLIAVTTDYDLNPAALTAILAEWARTDGINADYASRVTNLTNGTNGAPILNVTLPTVRSNGGGNTLLGNAERDFFFANSDLDTLDNDPDPLIEVLMDV